MVSMRGGERHAPDGWWRILYRYITINRAMPVDETGAVIEPTINGAGKKVPFAQAVERIKAEAGEAHWSPERQ